MPALSGLVVLWGRAVPMTAFISFRKEDKMKPAWMRMVRLCVVTLLSTTSIATGVASAESMDELVAAANKDGQVTVIALPQACCGYGPRNDGLKGNNGRTVN